MLVFNWSSRALCKTKTVINSKQASWLVINLLCDSQTKVWGILWINYQLKLIGIR